MPLKPSGLSEEEKKEVANLLSELSVPKSDEIIKASLSKA